MNKTNVMRILETAGITYSAVEYEVDENDLSGVHTAGVLGLPPEQLFKTLVARGEKNSFLVFCIPSNEELDLKKAARAAADKRAELLHVKELLQVTGYIRGGCSPVGMKKAFPTYIDETAILWDEILVSAGVRGMMLKVEPQALAELVEAKFADLVKE